METNENHEIYIEAEQLEYILVKLPIHCVFRFKCVSKYWRYIISQPTFANYYVSCAIKTSKFTHRFLLLFDGEIKYERRRQLRRFIPPTADSALRELMRDELPVLVAENDPHEPTTFFYLSPRRVKPFSVIAESSGFFLLYGNDRYFIYNYVTWETVAIPAHRLINPQFAGFMTEIEGALVAGFRIVQAMNERGMLVFHKYSSESGKWNEYESKSFHLCCWDTKIPKFIFKKHLHWVNCLAGLILAYDPFNQTKECRALGFPNGPFHGLEVCFSVSKEYLRLIEKPRPGPQFPETVWICVVWRLEDYYKEEWCLERKITYDWWNPTFTLRPRSLIPLLGHPNNPDVVYLCHFMLGEIISFNLQTRRVCLNYNWKYFRFQFTDKPVLQAEVPIWPSPIPRPKDKTNIASSSTTSQIPPLDDITNIASSSTTSQIPRPDDITNVASSSSTPPISRPDDITNIASSSSTPPISRPDDITNIASSSSTPPIPRLDDITNIASSSSSAN